LIGGVEVEGIVLVADADEIEEGGCCRQASAVAFQALKRLKVATLKRRTETSIFMTFFLFHVAHVLSDRQC